jgi:hypothetical protein
MSDGSASAFERLDRADNITRTGATSPARRRARILALECILGFFTALEPAEGVAPRRPEQFRRSGSGATGVLVQSFAIPGSLCERRGADPNESMEDWIF